MDLGGLPVTFLDMAGIRETDDAIETLGVSRAKSRAETADIRVFLLDGVSPPGSLGVESMAGDIVLRAKADIVEVGVGIPVSGLTGAGVDDLLSFIQTELGTRVAGASVASHARHRIAIDEASQALREGVGHLSNGKDQAELAAVEIMRALRGIDFLVGSVDIENVLGEIFASFCIGK